jgi:NADPH-dependent curcumin reductase CurA
LPDLSISPRRIVAVRSPETDEVLLDTMYVSVDPGMRLWLTENSVRAACGDWCGDANR